MLAPGTGSSVTVGAVVELMITGKSCDNGCCFVQQHPPLQGTYEMIPSTWIVTAYKSPPAGATLLTEKRGWNTGVVSAQHEKHKRCVMFTMPAYGLVVLPSAGVNVMSAG